MKVFFYTLGCKVNQYDTQAMLEAFASKGHTAVGSDEPADIYVINSCTVTAESDRKTRQAVRR
ncbi:MAG TPA: tRNA (N(6)-L-threonylcarbamoyladenosine(37)-C(2))-methylthiotransferase MtaB, partial [Oscillospiraceae bacterium]|nr:tRNA (N(6)-L-threonylcarbamoyladenosine(37)-C(2))-methylthiotransferase MtaB [Oscillospiraceae bacterium]